MTAFKPGASPPPVLMAIRRIGLDGFALGMLKLMRTPELIYVQSG
jgi:hypothetical protein